MRYGKLLVAALVVGMSTLAQAAAITTSLRLQTTDGTDITPTSPGVYTIASGTTVQVVLSALVTNPNLTDTNRNANVNGQPLGLTALNVNIVTPGTVGRMTPQDDGGGGWNNYSSNVAGAFSSVNLVDTDTDGDLDAAGVGMGLTSFSLSTSASVSALAAFQQGVTAEDIASGWYTVNSNSPITLQALMTAGVVYGEPTPDTNGTAAQKAALQGYDVLAGSTSGSIQINSVPEPAMMSLAGLAGLSMLGIRRRRA